MEETNKTPYANLMLRMLRNDNYYDHYGTVRTEQDQTYMDRLVKHELVKTNGEKKLELLKYMRIFNF
jgi:hypothetical protein